MCLIFHLKRRRYCVYKKELLLLFIFKKLTISIYFNKNLLFYTFTKNTKTCVKFTFN